MIFLKISLASFLIAAALFIWRAEWEWEDETAEERFWD